MTEVRQHIEVAVPPERAFQTWTERIDEWWPPGHCPSGQKGRIVLTEGRFYEVTPDGRELDFGKVVEWNPPHSLACDWYLGSGPSQPSRVVVHFREVAPGRTRVEVVHTGPGWADEMWTQRATRFTAGWTAVLASFASAGL